MKFNASLEESSIIFIDESLSHHVDVDVDVDFDVNVNVVVVIANAISVAIAIVWIWATRFAWASPHSSGIVPSIDMAIFSLWAQWYNGFHKLSKSIV